MPTYRSIPANAIRIPLPDTRQGTDYTCGSSCLQSVCGYYGVGPEEEEEFTSAMGIRRNVGPHPHNIIRGARLYHLHCEEKWPMTVEEVQSYLDREKPVLLMIQAWGSAKQRRRGYRNEWKEGHWVVAIGYDRAGMYFEDPSLAARRGYLTYEALMRRWRDVGPYWRKSLDKTRPYDEHVHCYGIAIWKPGTRRPPYCSRATRIE